ncbi:MAG: glycosyltransferase family 4 protein [Acidimicrobiales bacterium]
MRIAITHPYSWPEVRRGAERIVVETSRAMAARGHELTVLTSGSNPGEYHQDGIRTVRLRRIFDDPSQHERSFGYRVAPYLARGRFDVVHCMMARDAYAAVRTRFIGGHRVVYDEMGIPYRWYWNGISDGRVRKRLVKSVDVYGCMSQHALSVLRRDWGREGSLIPGGVRLSQFPVGTERATDPTILFSGALAEPRKGVSVLLEAAVLASAQEPRLKVWLSGPGDPGPILAAAPAAARSMVEVLPIGTPEQQGERYRRAWVTALPSVSESFGLVLIESLASGTPIVVVDDAAPPELVTPETGAIAKPRDPVSLASALCEGVALAQKLETAERCREFARQFDWDEHIAPLLEGLYEGAS